jgi:hypothetical protein
MKQLRNPPLTADEIHEAIDEGIAELIMKWHKQKLPHKQRKAFKLWRKYRQKELRRERLRKKQLEIDHVSKRIAKMRKESRYSLI